MENSRPATGYPAPTHNGYPPPNTAYPYSAAPPQSQPYSYPPYYQPPTRRNNLLRPLVVAAVAVTVILGCALLIFWLVVRPRIPEFHLTSLSVSNFSTNQSQVTGNWDAAIEAYNPNKKMRVSYYDVVSGIYYDGNYLTRTPLPPFSQDTRERTPLSAKFSVIDSYVERKVLDSINAERARGAVKFDFRLEAIAGFKYGGWRTRRRLVRVWCPDVPVNVSSKGSGSLVGGARKCRFEVRVNFMVQRIDAV
ncbi:LEA 2 domain-containing protein [Citrus sinensis]|nr:LEA 2 domain-containing protein [Citrus sinensis]